MKPLAKFALIGVFVAGGVALAAALYLRKSHQAVERVVKPVELSAPDLYPAETLLYTEMQGWDKSFGRAEAWWKKFEGTAAHYALERGWKEDRLGLPPPVVETLEGVDKELDRAQLKFGYRPTTRQFFETYGKHIAIGLLPAPKGERPRLLLATRLPEDATQGVLKESLSKAGGVKACDPPLHKGFPLFEEKAGGGAATVYYGVGRGYLFVSDGLPELKAALERLALATDEKKKPEKTLASDPVLSRVRPPKGQSESGVIYIRREQKFGEWMEELKPVDDFVRNAFVLAPKDEAVAFSMPDGPDGAIRCSFQESKPRPWTKSLPQGLCQLEASLGDPAADVKKRNEEAAAAFFNKPLWKALDEFLSDPKAVKKFLAEALPPEDRPDDEIAKRLPNDARFVGAWLKSSLESAVDVSAPQYAMAVKAYGGVDGAVSGQTAYGIDLDPLSVFVLAGALDFARSHASEWILRDEKPGVLIWSLDMKRAMQEMRENAPPQMQDMVETYVASFSPSLVIAGSRVALVLGPELAKEIAAINSGGGASFEEDPLYVEARGLVRPGYNHVSWDRPYERIRAGWGPFMDMMQTMFQSQGHDEEPLEIFTAGLKTVNRIIGWSKTTRATLSTSYGDAARPSESVELLDPETEKKVPQLVPADAAARVPGFLPADTWLCLMQRLELKPSYDGIRAAFVESLPGGEERLKKIFVPQEKGEGYEEVVGALVDGIVRNVKGEVGIAVARPLPREGEEPQGMAMIVGRWPAVVLFAEFEKPDEAFKSVKVLLEKLNGEINRRPFRERLAERGEWDPLPFGTELKVGTTGTGKCPALAMDVFLPMGEEYVVLSLCVLERSGFLFFTNSPQVLTHLGTAEEKDAATLAGRLAKSLPAGVPPAKVSALGIFHGDTLVAQVRQLLEPVTKSMVGLTLQGYEEGPPPDRVQAHQEGWTRWMDLVLDLFKTKSWSVSSTSRTGNVNKSATIVVPEK